MVSMIVARATSATRKDRSQTVIDAVRALLPDGTAVAADVDRQRGVSSEMIDRLHDTGFFALLQPHAAGGLEAEPDDYLTAALELSTACTSTGWLAAWLAV